MIKNLCSLLLLLPLFGLCQNKVTISATSSFSITDGSGTTSDGTAVNLGGTMSADVEINLNSFAYKLLSGSDYIENSDDGTSIIFGIKSTVSRGFAYLKAKSTDGGSLFIANPSGNAAELRANNLSTNRTFQFPNYTGTLQTVADSNNTSPQNYLWQDNNGAQHKAAKDWLTTGVASSTYMPLAGGTFIGNVYGITAPSGTNTTQIATTLYVWDEVRQRAFPRNYFDSLMGSTIKYQNHDGWGMNSAVNGAILVNQRMYFSVVDVHRTDTITGVKWKQIIQGSYTSNNYNGVAVYSLSGGTATLVASSTNDGNIWTASANTIGSKAFSSSVVLQRGVYVVAILWCRSAQTTVPQIAYLGTSSAVNGVNDYTNSTITSGYIDAQTSFPSSFNMSSATFNANEFAFGLYK